MSPTSGMTRGTRRDRYSREPSSRAFTTGMRLGPSRNVQLYMRDQRLAGDRRIRAGSGLPQGHHVRAG